MGSLERRCSARILSNQGALLAHVGHELYRVGGTEASAVRNGLTAKEAKYLQQRMGNIYTELEKLRPLTERLLHHG